MYKFKLVFVVMNLLVFSYSLFAQKEKKFIRQGNKEYAKGQFRDAEELYQKALNIDSGSYIAGFNLGDAFYKQKNYTEAEKRFANLANTAKDKKELANIYHNLGNTQLYSCKSDLDSGKIEPAMNKVNASINSYKNALRQNPNDKETKYNLYYAQNLLKQMENQKKENKDDKKDDKKDKKDKDKKDQKDQKDQQKEDKKKDEQKQKQQQQQISKEDAERMLEAMKNDEKKVQEKLKKEKILQKVKKEKNW